MNELIEFTVANMRGDSMTYNARSIEELRMRLAIEAGVLSACILLFKGPEKRMIEDTHQIDEEFGNANQPHQLVSINNLEGVKREVSDWSAKKWIHAVKLHVQFEDQNVVQHAESLITADEGFQGKIHRWVVDMIDSMMSYEDVDKHAGDIKAAIALGLDVHTNNGLGGTLLHPAAKYGHVELIHALLNAEVGVNERYINGRAVLLCKGEAEAFRAILPGAGPSLAEKHGWAPIHMAASHGHADVVTFLIEAKVNVNIPGHRGWTPLHCAAFHGHAEVIRILIRAGSNEEARDDDGNTPQAEDGECRRILRGPSTFSQSSHQYIWRRR